MSRPEEGDRAPDFTLPADGGRTISLADFAGKPVVLFMYPRDNTSGCTKEAVGFTAALPAFEAAGAAILGLSADSVASHDKFVAKQALGMPLLSDEDAGTIAAYGAWVEKSMYGKKYMGIERSTFLIGADGTLKRIWRKVKVPGHVDEVLAAVKAL